MFDEAVTSYNFGPTHPMAPVRVEMTLELAGGLGVGHQLLGRLGVGGRGKATNPGEGLEVRQAEVQRLAAAHGKAGQRPVLAVGSDQDPRRAESPRSGAVGGGVGGAAGPSGPQVWEEWWCWTIIGAVVAGGVTVGLGFGLPGQLNLQSQVEFGL